jgi:hypothetical protein
VGVAFLIAVSTADAATAIEACHSWPQLPDMWNQTYILQAEAANNEENLKKRKYICVQSLEFI